MVVIMMMVFQLKKNLKKEASQTKDYDIYLLIGQSNMAGRAEIQTQDKDTLEGVFLYKGMSGQDWEKAANPLNKYSTIRKDLSMQKLNLGYTFAIEMDKSSEKSIGLVVNAKGGTSIDLWAPESEFYKEAVKRTEAALKYGVLKGVLWHQGESDASQRDTYMAKLMELISALRSDFGISDLPFVVGELSGENAARAEFNKMLLELPERLEKTAVVKSDSTGTFDGLHFDSASQRLLGERYAAEMKKLSGD